MKGVKLSADYWTVRGSMEVGDLGKTRSVREAIDWTRLEALVADPGGELYNELVGSDA